MPILKLSPEMMLGEYPTEQTSTQVSSGAVGNLETVDFMIGVARKRSGHPSIRDLAEKIILHSKITSHNYVDEAVAIGRFVQRRMRYVKDGFAIERLQDPVTLIDKLRRGEAMGDCDDMALLIATLLLSIGHHPFFRVVKFRAAINGFEHIYVVDYASNGRTAKKRVVLDAIIKDRAMGYEVKHHSGKEIAT